MIIKSQKPRYKKFFIPVISVALVTAVIGGTLWYRSNKNSAPANNTTTDLPIAQQEEKIDLSPPTENDAQSVNDNKDRLVDNQNNSTPPATDKKSVTPIIVYADKNGLTAYISGILEDGGTCTATATKDTDTITRTVTAFGDVSKTQCPPIDWTLSAGTWSVTLSYASAAAQGSAQKTVEVQ